MHQGPQPRITDVNRPFWDGCREGRLVLQRCADPACARFVFYPRVCCPYCGGGTLTWEDVSGSGHLQSWTVVHRPGHEAFMPDVPYVFAAVTLIEGPLMYGRLRAEPGSPALAIGTRMRAVFPAVPSGAVLPVFVLAGDGAQQGGP
jgi:uncharacterized OB-fold protein